MPASLADRARKLARLAADPAATEGERANAGAKLAALLKAHPELLSDVGASAPPPPRPPPRPKGSRPKKGRRKAPQTPEDAFAEVVRGLDLGDVKRAVRVAGRAAGYAGLRKAQAGAAVVLDLLNEWTKE